MKKENKGCRKAFVTKGYDIHNICGVDIGPEECPYCNSKANARKYPKGDL